MADEIARLSGRGTVTLPAAVRRALGLTEGDVLSVRVDSGSIVLTPAVVTPVELYTDQRLEEFRANAELDEEEVDAARAAWRAARRGR